MVNCGYLWFPTLHFVDEVRSVMQKMGLSMVCWNDRAKTLLLNIGQRKSLKERVLHKRY